MSGWGVGEKGRLETVELCLIGEKNQFITIVQCIVLEEDARRNVVLVMISSTD